jgi:hypothetical protein
LQLPVVSVHIDLVTVLFLRLVERASKSWRGDGIAVRVLVAELTGWIGANREFTENTAFGADFAYGVARSGKSGQEVKASQLRALTKNLRRADVAVWAIHVLACLALRTWVRFEDDTGRLGGHGARVTVHATHVGATDAILAQIRR